MFYLFTNLSQNIYLKALVVCIFCVKLCLFIRLRPHVSRRKFKVVTICPSVRNAIFSETTY